VSDEPRQMLFGEDPDGDRPAADDLPLIYVASALSSLDEGGQKLVDAWCHVIKEAIIEGSAEIGGTPRVRFHAPVDLSAPWRGEFKKSEDIYDLNFATVIDSDGLVAIGHQGGSFGGGQELGWATSLRMPIFYVHHVNDKISRQVYGTPTDLDFFSWSTTDDLAQAVRRFIRERFHRIEAHHRARRSRAMTFALPLARLRQRWRDLGPDERRAVCAVAALHARQVEWMLRNTSALAVASLDVAVALCAALGLTTQSLFETSPLPDLSEVEMHALRAAVREHDLDSVEAFQLQIDARLELARGGTRRFNLTTPEDWIRFFRDRG
jgi:hypothetical protein